MEFLKQLQRVYAKDKILSIPFATRPDCLNFFSDGGTRREPAAASSAVVVKNERGQVVDWFSRLLPVVSSIEAEYYGVLDAFELGCKLAPLRAFFHLDNMAVAGQLAGQFRVRDPKLKLLHARAQHSIVRLRESGCSVIEFYHIPREFNLLADALSADALLWLPEQARQEMRAVSKEPTSGSIEV